MIKRKELYKGSEEERFIKAQAKCRSCEHMKMVHFKTCIDFEVDREGIVYNCKCKGYIPKDNLEFLEYKLDKKPGKKK